MTEEQEIWKPLPGYEKWYDISNMGNIRSFHLNNSSGTADRRIEPRMMAATINTYIYATLSKGIGVAMYKAVHILVAKAFVENPHKRKWVHHKNNDKLDPRAANLEWLTPGQNQKYAYEDGLRERPVGIKNGRCKLTPTQVLYIFNSKENYYKLAAEHDVGLRAIGDIKNGKLWSSVTGKKYKKKAKRWVDLSEVQIIVIFKSKTNQALLAKEYKTSQARISAIKTGRSHSNITGVKFKGKREYNYFGRKTTVGRNKAA